MCKNATATAAGLLEAIEPTLKQFLTLENISTEQQTVVLNAFNAAVTAVQNWQHGTDASEVVQVINDLDNVFNQLPVPPADQVIANLITGGITAVLAVIEANSPQGSDEALNAADTKIKTLAPAFKRSIFTPAGKQFTAHVAKVATTPPTPTKFAVLANPHAVVTGSSVASTPVVTPQTPEPPKSVA